MKEKCSFAMAAPPTPPTGWLTLPKSHLTLQRHIHRTSAVALHLLHGSIALSPRQHHTTVKTHREPQLGATVGCRKAGARHTAWDSCLSSVKMKQPLDSLWKEMEMETVWGREEVWWKIIPLTAGKAGGYSWAGVSAGGHVRWMVRVLRPDFWNLLSICTSPHAWGRRRSQPAVTWVYCLREAVRLELCMECFIFFFILNEET